MYFGSGQFDCYMTSQTEHAATASLYRTSYVLSPGYRHLPSARQCVLPSIESIKANKQLFCLISLKGQKRLRFRVIHLIQFIQSNNFHIYSIFFMSAVYSECDFKVKNSNEIHDGLDAAIGEGLTWLGHSARGILCLC